MNVVTKDYFKSYMDAITADEILLLQTIFHKYPDVPFEFTITAQEFMGSTPDNYKRLFIAANNLYAKYVNFDDGDYGFQIRWLQKVETDLAEGVVRIQWSDDLFKHLDILKNCLTKNATIPPYVCLE